VELHEADGEPLLSFRSLIVKSDLNALLQGSLTVKKIELQSPWVHLQINQDGKLNLAQLIADASTLGGTEAETESAATAPIRYLIEQLHIENGTIKVSDLSATTPALAYVVPLNIELSKFGNQPGVNAPLTLTATTNSGGTLRWQGDFSLEPLSSHGIVKLEKIKLLALWEFLRDKLNIDPPHGSVDLQASYDFSYAASGLGLVVEGLRMELSDLLLRRTGTTAPLLVLQSIALSDGRFELEGNKLAVGQLRLAGGALRIAREKRLIDWQSLVNRTEERSTTTKDQTAAEPPPDWSVQLTRFGLESVALIFAENDLNRPVEISIGNVNLSLSANAQQRDGLLAAGVNDLDLALQDISMSKAGMPERLLQIDQARLQQGQMDLAAQSILIEKIALNGGKTQMVRQKDGRIDWENVWQQKEAQPIADSTDQTQSKAKPWRVDVAKFSLDEFNLALSDQTPPTPAQLHLSPITLQLSGISSALDKPIGLELGIAVNEGGKLNLSGQLNAGSPAAELDVKLEQLSLLPLRPYLQPVANIELKSGRFSSNGHLSYASSGQGALSYKGAVRIDELLVTESSASSETLIGWKLLDAAELNLSLQPEGLRIKEVLLTQPAGKFVIDKERNTNWQNVFIKQNAVETTDVAATTSEQFPVSVERLQIDDGQLDFADFSLPLPFSTRVHDLNGSIIGISTAPGARASSSLKGRVDEFGSASIKGEIAPFDPLLFTDMRVIFTNLNMADMTPYTAKFAGYAIDSGKLSLDLGYKIDGRKLQGENQIVLNQLKLGDKVESPDAIDAPLELAIALMQDSKGIIDLGLPIRGNLDDPEFSIGHLVVKAVGNLITKIVTAPFRLLGALFSIEADDLDSVAFEPGSSNLAPPEQEKLLGVAKVLRERPKLMLEIQGQFDKNVDGAALRELAIREEIGRRLGRKPAAGSQPDPVSLTDSAIQVVLEELFAERVSAEELAKLKNPDKPQQGVTGTGGDGKGPKPEEQPALAQAVAPRADLYEKLYRRLIDTHSLGVAELKNLANDRAREIAQSLKETGKVADVRIRQLEAVPVTATAPSEVISKLNLGVAK